MLHQIMGKLGILAQTLSKCNLPPETKPVQTVWQASWRELHLHMVVTPKSSLLLNWPVDSLA